MNAPLTNNQSIVYNQGDLNEDFLTITLTHQNGVMNLSTATDITIYFQRQDGTVTSQNLTNGLSIQNASGGVLALTLYSGTLTVPGSVTAEVHVSFPSNQVIVFKKFTFTVESALTASTQSQNTYQVLVPLQVVTSVSALPTASTSYRGVTFFVQGASGTADAAYMCKKLSDDTYDWVQYA